MGGLRSMRSAIGLVAAGFCLSLAGGGEASAQQRVVPPCVAMPSIRDSGIDQLCNSNGSWGFEFRPIAGKIRDPQGSLEAVWMLGGLYGSPENRTVYNVDEATRWLKLAIPSDPEKAYIQICSIHATGALAQKQLNVPALTKAMAWCAIAEKQALSAPPEQADTGVVDLTSPISRQAEAYSKAIGEVFAKRLGQTGLGPLLNAQNFAKKCRANGYEACGL